MSFIFQAEFVHYHHHGAMTNTNASGYYNYLTFPGKKEHNWMINECRQDLTGERQGETVVKDWGRLVTSHSEQTTVKSILVTNRLPGFLILFCL